MATYKQVSYGSQGSEVTELQKLLNNNGYNLSEDGIFGEKTQAAVKDYQNKTGLVVDGIVGTNTWGALTNAQSSSPSASTPAAAAPAAPTAPTFEYKPSDAVTQADALLQQQLANKPGEWQGGTWTDNLNDTISQILNREKFSYDLNGDMLYQQYKDQYTTQGKLAMMDTMGQAAAMTGGYGNSYAQTAGQQAYQGYLQQLNDVVPELYGMALDQYNQEGQDLYNQAGLMAQMDEQEYGRYQDNLSRYYTDLNYLTENARYMSETEYQKALDDFNIKYGQYRDTVADNQWNQTFQYQKEQDQKVFDEGVRQFNESNKGSGSGGSGGGSGGSGGSGGGNTGGGNAGGNPGDDVAVEDSSVIEGIRGTLSGMKSNTAVESYLENLEATGAISHDTALQLMAEYMDSNEVYKPNDDGSKSISYSDMVKSTSGWTVIDNGGVNWFWGVDNNAIVEAPNGERIRLDNLVDKLVAEGMKKSDAKSLVKALQKNLGS